MSIADTDLKPNLRIAGTGYERNASGVCDLYMTIGPNSFSCATTSPSARRFLSFEFWELDQTLSPFLLNQIFNGSTLLKSNHTYRKVNGILFGKESMFIPSSLFDATNLKEQMTLAFGDGIANKLIQSEELPMMQIHSCYTSNSSIISTISNHFRHAEFHHVSATRLRYLSAISGPGKEVLVVIDLNGAEMNITAVKSSSLLFHNSFEFNTPEELTYYMLLVFEQLKLNPETVEVFFTGNTHKEDAAFQLASKYVANCRLAGLPGVYTYESEFSFLDANRHFNLFCGPVCVS
jgi:hypothetical protein